LSTWDWGAGSAAFGFEIRFVIEIDLLKRSRVNDASLTA
jgi:hypothetical protein